MKASEGRGLETIAIGGERLAVTVYDFERRDRSRGQAGGGGRGSTRVYRIRNTILSRVLEIRFVGF